MFLPYFLNQPPPQHSLITTHHPSKNTKKYEQENASFAQAPVGR